MKQVIIDLLKKELEGKLSEEEIANLIEVPPDESMGDFAFPCFSLAKIEKKNPAMIAENLAKKIKFSKEISKIEVKSAYLNFFVNKNILAQEVLKSVLKEQEKYGSDSLGKGKKIVIDMSSPNIAKPFGIGHLRSTIIGNSIANICEKIGFKAVKINYLGDWGTQFGKLIVGLKKFGNEEEMKKSKDFTRYMLDLYVRGNAEEYEEEARVWFKKLEEKDKEALRLWGLFRDLSLKEFDSIYKILGVKFDVISGESEYNNKMEAVVAELRQKKLLEENEGAQIVDLNKYGLGVCLIKKSDGATLYATRDITAALDRYKKYKFTRMIYEVGQEQKLHFQQFFKVLELMEYKFWKDCVHVYHGLYLDSDGKKFATRKGKTVFMSEILQETIDLAKKTIEEKNPDLKNKEEIARIIAVSAIFYGDLKNNRTSDIIFDIDKFLDFDGNTGPYLLYSYARASSIARKAAEKNKDNKKGRVISRGKKDAEYKLNDSEIRLVKKFGEFPPVITRAYEQLSPNLVANYAYELSQLFNEFYHTSQVIESEQEEFRLKLVEAFRIILRSSLNLLGIETVEEM